MAFQFPTGSASGSTVTNPLNGVTYTWNGAYWDSRPVTSSNAITASFAITASYALNGGGGTSITYVSSSFAYNNKSAGGGYTNNFVPTWDFSYTSSTNTALIEVDLTAVAGTSTGVRTIELHRDGVMVATSSRWYSDINNHLNHPRIQYIDGNALGSHAYRIKIPANTSVDQNDFATSLITEYIASNDSTASYATTASFAQTASYVQPFYLNAIRSGSVQSSIGSATDLIFNGLMLASGVTYNTSSGVFTLGPGIWRIDCQAKGFFPTGTNSFFSFTVVTSGSNTRVNSLESVAQALTAGNVGSGPTLSTIINVTTQTSYKIRTVGSNVSDAQLDSNSSWLTIQKIG